MIRGVSQQFNRGEVEKTAFAREDIKRIQNSAEDMTNFIPQRLGPMSYRPGMEYMSGMSSSEHYLIPFVSSVGDSAILDFTSGSMKIYINENLLEAGDATATITNGEFTTDIAGWTTITNGGSTATHNASGALALKGTGTDVAIAHQTIAVSGSGEVVIQVKTLQGSIDIEIGSSGYGSSDIYKGTILPGTHVFSIPVTSNITIAFKNRKPYEVLVDSIINLSSSVISYDISVTDLVSIRYKQSIDIIYIAHSGKPLQIERRGEKSWSVVDSRFDDGPFGNINNTAISMQPSALNGDVTITASESYFKASDVGKEIKISSSEQNVGTTVSTDTGAGTNSIKVTGGADRHWTSTISGVTTASVTLQRSFDNVTWQDLGDYATNGTRTHEDPFNNAIVYYRLYVKAGNNPNLDTVSLALNYVLGSIEGVARITAFTSDTVVSAQVLEDFGSTNPSKDWYPSAWRDYYPSALEIYEGRLWYAGKDKYWASVSDAYTSFDNTIEGNSKSISGTIGFGSIDPIQWINGSNKLVVGTTGEEIGIRSSSYGEALSQTNINVKEGSNQGSANNAPVIIDNVIYYVQRSATKLQALSGYVEQDTLGNKDVMKLHENICSSGIKRIAFTRQPETRLYIVTNNGECIVYTLDNTEEVAAFSRIETDGLIQDVVVLPGANEDRVYFVVERDGNKALEKLAMYKDKASKYFDSHLNFTSPGATISLPHLDGETVGVHADGEYRGTFAVSAGNVTLPSAWTDVVAGLPYTASYKSNVLGGYVDDSVLSKRKRLVDTGLMLTDYYHDGLKVGASTSLLSSLPLVEYGEEEARNTLIPELHTMPFEFNGDTEVDPRIHIQATLPCTILALTYGVEDGEAYPHQ